MKMKKEKVIKGVALLITLVFVLILGIGAVAIVRLHSMEISLVRRQNNSTRAFYIAEAGLEFAHNGLEQNWDFYTSELPFDDAFSQCLEIGSCFTVDIESWPLQDTIRVISTGTVGGAERTVEEVITGTTGPGCEFAALAAGNFKMTGGSITGKDVYVVGNFEVQSPDAVTGGDIYAVGNVTLTGTGSVGSVTDNVNVYANGNITVEDGCRVDGDATAGASITKEGTGAITGDEYPDTFPLPVDAAAIQATADSYRLSDQDWVDYRTQAQAQGNYHDGAFTPESGEYTGIHYVEGALNIENDITGDATFVVTGSVSFTSGSINLDPASSVYSLIVLGSVEALETSTTTGTLMGIIYVEDNFKVYTGITIGGAVLSYGNLYGSGGFNIEFPVTGTTLEILSWREL